MLKKTITYTDYDGNERTETHYFNLTQAELTKMFASVDGGLYRYMTQALSAQSGKRIMEMLDMIIKASYGQKSLDGRKLMKSDEIYRDFEESLAYDKFFTDLLSNDAAAAEFIRGVIPKRLADEVREKLEARKNGGTENAGESALDPALEPALQPALTLLQGGAAANA